METPNKRNKHELDISSAASAAGTGISFASGGALLGGSLIGVIGSIIGAIILGIVGICIAVLMRHGR